MLISDRLATFASFHNGAVNGVVMFLPIVGLLVVATSLIIQAQVLTCPTSWNTIYGGRCVKFFSIKKTLAEAADLCRIFESELLSAGQELHEMADDLSNNAMDVSQVLLGLTDPWGTHLHQWMDGSLTDELMWADGHPKKHGGRCVVFRTAQKDLINVDCKKPHAFVCQKSRGFSGCYEAWEFGSFLTTVQPLVSDSLTLQVCIQVCRGRGDNLATVWQGSCYCLTHSTMGTVMRVGADKCNRPCSGNKAQVCGDTQGQYLSVLDIGQYSDTVSSCMELYIRGIRVQGPYMLQLSEDASPSAQTCYFTDLQSEMDWRLAYAPADWIFWSGHFYLFHITEEDTFDHHNELCFNQGGGYLTSVLSEEELDFIEITIRGSDQFSSVGEWLVGLTDVTTSGYLRWTGPVLFDNTPHLHQTCSASAPCCVVFSREDGAFLQDCSQDVNITSGIICKQAHDFRGCRNITTTSLPSSHHNASSGMTALLCKELCRGEGAEFAIVVQEDCYCDHNTTVPPEQIGPHWCNTSCPGHSDQFCGGGGGGVGLVYSVDEIHIEELAKTCDQLLYNGIDKPATYLFSTGLESLNITYSYDYCSFDPDVLMTSTLLPDSQIIHSNIETSMALIVSNTHHQTDNAYTLPESTISVYESGSISTDNSLEGSSILETTAHLQSSFGNRVATKMDSNTVFMATRSLLPSMTFSLKSNSPANSLSASTQVSAFRMSESLLPPSTFSLKLNTPANTLLSSTWSTFRTSESLLPSLTFPYNSPDYTLLSSEFRTSISTLSEMLSTSFLTQVDEGDSVYSTQTLFPEAESRTKPSLESSVTGMNSLHETDNIWTTLLSSTTDLLDSKPASIESNTGYFDFSTSFISPVDLDTATLLTYEQNMSDSIMKVTQTLFMESLSSTITSSLSMSTEISSSTNDEEQVLSQSLSDSSSPSLYSNSYVHCKSKLNGDEVTECPCLYLLTNAETSSCKTNENTSVILNCKVGWSFPGGHDNMTIVCGVEGRWIPQPHHCVPEVQNFVGVDILKQVVYGWVLSVLGFLLLLCFSDL